MAKKPLTYAQVGDNYDVKDPVKKLALKHARDTKNNLLKKGFEEIPESRGESAFVWRQGNLLLASVIEGLGTKNLIVEELEDKKNYYQSIAHDTVATIINDLITVGADPLVLNAYWAIPDNNWLKDKRRIKDLIIGWKKACDIAGVVWGGGETATLNGIITKGTLDLAGSAVGFIKDEKRLLTERKLISGDRIILLKSTGINANGASLIRALAKKLKNGYSTKLNNGKTFSEAALKKSNIYSRLVNELLDSKVEIHYISNITGHGLRKVMRSNRNFAYILEKIIDPPEVFKFIQEKLKLPDYEMYQTFNMGMDYALFIDPKSVIKALKIINKQGFYGVNAGYIKTGKRSVVIKPKNLLYEGTTLNLR